MPLKREHQRSGWFIYTNGRPWDGMAYPTEDAALKTAKTATSRNATVAHGSRQGYVDNEGRQYSQKMLFDSKQRQRQ